MSVCAPKRLRATRLMWTPSRLGKLEAGLQVESNFQEMVMKNVHEVRMPDIGDAKDVGVIEIPVKVGDAVVEGQTLIIVETDKASMEIPSPQTGVLQSLVVRLDDKVSEGSPIAFIENEERLAMSAPSIEPVATVAAPLSVAAPVLLIEAFNPPTDLPLASPSVRKFSRELGVSLKAIQGTGLRRRITKADVLAHVKGVLTVTETGVQPLGGLLPWPVVDFAKYGPVETRTLSRIRKISGANLHRNWLMIPHVTNHDDADITQLEQFRVQVNKEKAGSGVKLTLLALLMKACAGALKKFPEFNASINGDDLVLKRYCHIGFAADTPEGLVVPVIKDVDQKGVLAIAREMSALAEKARGQIERCRDEWRLLFDLVVGRYWRDVFHADHQCAGSRHSRGGQKHGTTRAGGRAGCRAQYSAVEPELGPSRDRWRDGGAFQRVSEQCAGGLPPVGSVTRLPVYRVRSVT